MVLSILNKLAHSFFKDKDRTDIDSFKAFLDELSRYERMGEKISDERHTRRRPEDNMIRAKREREALIKMLRATDVSLKEYQHMSDEEREDLEDYYETLRFRESGWVNRDPRLIEPDRHRWNDEGEYLGCY